MGEQSLRSAKPIRHLSTNLLPSPVSKFPSFCQNLKFCIVHEHFLILHFRQVKTVRTFQAHDWQCVELLFSSKKCLPRLSSDLVPAYSGLELGELALTVSHKNILAFLIFAAKPPTMFWNYRALQTNQGDRPGRLGKPTIIWSFHCMICAPLPSSVNNKH